jgi:hypothetical protein
MRGCLLALLLCVAALPAAERPFRLNFWIAPASPPGAWKPSGEAFPAERIVERAAAAGCTDIDLCMDNTDAIYYDSKVVPMKRLSAVPADGIDRLLAAARKHGIRVRAVVTPNPVTVLPDGTKAMTTSDSRAREAWRRRIEEIATRFGGKYPGTLAGIVLHEVNRPETGNSHAGELREFSEFCRREFGEEYQGTAMPDGRDGALWNRRFNLYRVDCLNRWCKAMIDEAARHGLETSFILYAPEAHRSFSASWGYDTLFYERHCDHIWVHEQGDCYPTLHGAYMDIGISYRGVNVAQVVARAFHEVPKGLFEFRSPFFPEVARAYYAKNRKFTQTHGDFFYGYSRKSPAVMRLFFGAENITRLLRAADEWTGAEPLSRVGVLVASLPSVLRWPVNPGREYTRCVAELADGLARRRPVTRVLLGSRLTLSPEELRRRFDLLVLPEEQGVGMSREVVEALRRYVGLGGKLLGVATPVTTARRDLTQEREVTAELFGVTVRRGEARVEGVPRDGTEFIPVGYTAATAPRFEAAVARLLPPARVELEGSTGLVFHGACEKDGVVCVSLPADAGSPRAGVDAPPASARLKVRLAEGPCEVRNLLTGEVVFAGEAAALAQGVPIGTKYPSEPYVLVAGPKAKMARFQGLYPGREVFAELGSFQATVQNPEVPLLIPQKAGLKVGIFEGGRGADRIFAALQDAPGVNAYLIPRLDDACIRGSEVVIVPQPLAPHFYRAGVAALRRGLADGRGVMLCHAALAGAERDFPEVFAQAPAKSARLKDARLHPAGGGAPFLPGFLFDRYDFAMKGPARVLATNTQGGAVVALAPLGKGRLVAWGTLLGHFGKEGDGGGTSEGEISGAEKALLWEAVRLLGEKN